MSCSSLSDWAVSCRVPLPVFDCDPLTLRPKLQYHLNKWGPWSLPVHSKQCSLVSEMWLVLKIYPLANCRLQSGISASKKLFWRSSCRNGSWWNPLVKSPVVKYRVYPRAPKISEIRGRGKNHLPLPHSNDKNQLLTAIFLSWKHLLSSSPKQRIGW